MAKMTIIETLIFVVSIRQWHNFFLTEAKNYFLNSDLHEEIYTKPPPSVCHTQGYVSKLRRLYMVLNKFHEFDLRSLITIVITSFGFHSRDPDSTFFLITTFHDRILLSFYIDDINITCDDVCEIYDLNLYLAKQFIMKNFDTLC